MTRQSFICTLVVLSWLGWMPCLCQAHKQEVFSKNETVLSHVAQDSQATNLVVTHHPGLTYWKRLGQQVFGVASSLGGITGSTYVLVATMLQTSLGQAHWATTIAMLSLQGLVMGMGMKGLFLTLKHKNASIVVQPDLKIGSEGEWQPGFLVSLSI